MDGVEEVEFYEALELANAGSESSDNDRARESARAIYFIGLVLQDRFPEAIQVVEERRDQQSFSLPYSVIRDIGTVQRGKVRRFLEDLLAEDPDPHLWETYLYLVMRGGDATDAAPFVRQILEGRSWDTATRLELRSYLARMLLMANEVPSALGMMREDAEGALDHERADRETLTQVLGQGVKIARAGRLLGDEDWERTGLTLAESADSRLGDRDGRWPRRELQRFYGEAGHFEKMQQMAVRQLKVGIAEMHEYRWGRPEAASQLIDLVSVFHLAERPEDVLVLLEEAPWWGEGDLSGLLSEKGLGSIPLGYMAASALAATGREMDAVEILREFLLEESGSDPAYELLLELDRTEALATVDRLFALDPFEERPLIWKAEVFRREGNLDEARELVERAIAIDPSDGEQGPGDRMRAYKVLANIFSDLGDEEQAAFYGEVVAAVRLSEEADQFYEAGLFERGVAMYREALDRFSDAYCIQSRLALQLEELGRFEEAEEHYRRAYELMPDSFGRVESHCFGCEGVFSGEQAQSVAERVFANLAEERPEQAQVWYLNGYLADARGRQGEAIGHFQRAVELDPDYLNAWSKLNAAGRSVHVAREMADRAAVEVLRLDPLGRHVRARLDDMADLDAMWTAVEGVEGRVPSRREHLFALPATAAFLETQPEYRGTRGSYRSGRSSDLSHPGEALARHNLLRALAEGLDAPL